MTHLKKNMNKENIKDNARLLTLLKADLNILAKAQAERWAFVNERLVNKVQIYAMPRRNIHQNRHLLCYMVNRIIKEPEIDGALSNLYKSKDFDMVHTVTWRLL